MAGRKKRRETAEIPPADIAAGMLADALEKGCDFLVTFEIGAEGEQCMHLMTGGLITPCMLGTLTNRCEMPEAGEYRHVVIRRDGKGVGKKP